MDINYRPIQQAEHSFLKEMLYEAIFVPPGRPAYPKSILEAPALRKYVEQWGLREGDLAIVAVHDKALIGAVWGRKCSAARPGFGFVDEHTPEISMAVKANFRNYGIGRSLLQHIEAAYQQVGVSQLSLSVDMLNPAVRLYQRCGFGYYAEVGTAYTMRKSLVSN